jgi:hypothetical protein
MKKEQVTFEHKILFGSPFGGVGGCRFDGAKYTCKGKICK